MKKIIKFKFKYIVIIFINYKLAKLLFFQCNQHSQLCPLQWHFDRLSFILCANSYRAIYSPFIIEEKTGFNSSFFDLGGFWFFSFN